ncbi:MAG: D-tyrosyl-tRNA(Tyr) deacylase, partial [Planctomycetaceae bacterium]|nr:D-tyrosyl-tRNA(Tyr) deacylase [Planctomycetaceae bacterium]
KVTVGEEVTGEIGFGLLVLLGVAESDTDGDLNWLVNKVCGLRIFEDETGKMNRSVEEVGGSLLVVSQFTLYGDCRKGRRPSFVEAARPEIAEARYVEFCTQCRQRGLTVATGRFRAEMAVELVNDGPVTVIVDSQQ